ncbi:MAG: glycosyltransferase family 2 protein [Oscillospiraceae bacterium]
MKASIIIPNLNGEGWLQSSIESCINQRFKYDYEIIVIDNGSKDNSVEIIKACAAKFNNFVFLQNDDNTGFSYAVNQGINHSTAEYAVLFNNDAFAQEDFLQELVDMADSDENIFSVGSLMIQHYHRELCDDAGDYVPLFGWTCKRGDGLSKDRYQTPQRIFTACGGAALYRKSILEEIGLFDVSFFAYGEDVDLGWRANNRGYKNMFCPKAVCYHICSATTGGRYNEFKSVQSGKNTLLLLYKNQPLFMFLFNLPFIFFGFLPKLAAFTVRGYGKPFLKGTVMGIKAFGRVEKPPFNFRHLKAYLWVEWTMFKNIFVYIDYRLKRLFNIL